MRGMGIGGHAGDDGNNHQREWDPPSHAHRRLRHDQMPRVRGIARPHIHEAMRGHRVRIHRVPHLPLRGEVLCGADDRIRNVPIPYSVCSGAARTTAPFV